MARIVSYLRVSTDRKAEHALGLEIQEAAIRSWLKLHGHRIFLWAPDEGASKLQRRRNAGSPATGLAPLQAHTAAGLVV
jgi:hypothetical protein